MSLISIISFCVYAIGVGLMLLGISEARYKDPAIPKLLVKLAFIWPLVILLAGSAHLWALYKERSESL